MKTFKACTLLLFFCHFAVAQSQTSVDSLQKILTTNISNQQKTDTYNLLAKKYRFSDLARAVRFASQAISLAKQIGYKKGEAYAYDILGRAYRQKNPLKALDAYQHSLRIKEQTGDKKGISFSYNAIGNLYRRLGNYAKALEAYRQAIKIREQTGNKKRLAGSYNNIGLVYRNQGNYSKALSFFKKSIVLKEQIGDKKGAAFSYNHLGLVYSNMGNPLKALEFYQRSFNISKQTKDKISMAFSQNNMGDVYRNQSNYAKALEFYQRSLKLNKQINDKRGLGFNYNDIGEVYRLQENHTKALEFLKKSLQVRQQIKDKSGIAENYLNLGKTALAQKQTTIAKQYFTKALGLRQKMGEKSRSAEVCVNLGIAYYTQQNQGKAQTYLKQGVDIALRTGNPTIVRDGAEYLAKVYQATGKIQQALNYQILFKTMTDSLLNARNIQQITRLQGEFVAQKREDSLQLIQAKEKALFKADIRQRKLTQRTTYIGLGLSGVLMAVLLFFYRSKQRSNRELNNAYEELNQFNEELQTANDTIHVAHEEIKNVNESLAQKNKDITASITYAQRIQQAMLPFENRMQATFPEYFTLFRPRDIVSGDFYWFEEDKGKQFIAVADCTGHGVPGAFMTLIGSLALTNIVTENKVHAPEKILLHLDMLLRKILKSDNTMVRDGMDIMLCVIDPQKQELCCAGAKSPLLVVQNNQIREIKGSMYSINGHRLNNASVTFTSHTIDLSVPTTFYMYSDGYQDQFGGENGKKFMKKRFRELLFGISHQPMNQQQQILENTLGTWMEGQEQVDDILVMGMQHSASGIIRQ